MKFYTVCDNVDTLMGLRLAGIEGEVAHTADEVRTALAKAMENPDIGIVLMTEKAIDTCPDLVYRYKLHRKRPLIVEIPDRHGAGDISETIARYLHEAVGVQI